MGSPEEGWGRQWPLGQAVPTPHTPTPTRSHGHWSSPWASCKSSCPLGHSNGGGSRAPGPFWAPPGHTLCFPVLAPGEGPGAAGLATVETSWPHRGLWQLAIHFGLGEKAPVICRERDGNRPQRRASETWKTETSHLDTLPSGRLMVRDGDTCLGVPTPHPKL